MESTPKECIIFDTVILISFDKSKIEKIFRIDSKDLQNRFVKLVNDMPANHLELTKKIIDFAEKELNVQFDDSIFVGLADHISFSIKRAKENDQLKNALLWEIKKFYKLEFENHNFISGY